MHKQTERNTYKNRSQVIVSSLANPIDNVIINSSIIVYIHFSGVNVVYFDYFTKRQPTKSNTHTHIKWNTKSLISNATYVEKRKLYHLHFDCEMATAIECKLRLKIVHHPFQMCIEFRLLFGHGRQYLSLKMFT